MSQGKPIGKPVLFSALQREFERDVNIPNRTSEFRLSDYFNLRVFDGSDTGYVFLPKTRISFGNFVGTQYYFEPYPTPEIMITDDLSDKTVFQNTGNHAIRITVTFNFKENANPKFRPRPTAYAEYTWQVSTNNGASWSTVSSSEEANDLTPNISSITVNSGDTTTRLYRVKIRAYSTARSDQDPTNPNPPVLTVASAETVSNVITFRTQQAAAQPVELTVTDQPDNSYTEVYLSNQNTVLFSGTAVFNVDYRAVLPAQHFSRPPSSQSVVTTWQYSTNGGSSWANITGNSIPGVSGPVITTSQKQLTVSNITNTDLDGYRFRAVITAKQIITNVTETLTVQRQSDSALLRVYTESEAAPSYSLTPSSAELAEGTTQNFELTTARHRTGTVYWRILNSSGIDVTNDYIIANCGSGTKLLNPPLNGKLSFCFETQADNVPEANQVLTVQVSTDSAYSNTVASSTITLVDTTPVINITSSVTVTEGNTATFYVTGNQFARNRSFAYTITDSADFVDLGNTVRLDNNGNSRITVKTRVGTVTTVKNYTLTVYLGGGTVAATGALTVTDLPALSKPTVSMGTLRSDSTTVYLFKTPVSTTVTQTGNLAIEFDSNPGYSVRWPAGATSTSLSYQWQVRSGNAWNTVTTEATTTTAKGVYINNITNTSQNGIQFRMKVTATATNAEGDVSVTVVYSNAATGSVDQVVTVDPARILSVRQLSAVLGLYHIPVEIVAKDMSGKRMRIQLTNNTGQFGARDNFNPADFDIVFTPTKTNQDGSQVQILQLASPVAGGLLSITPLNKLMPETDTITVSDASGSGAGSVSGTITVRNETEQVTEVVITSSVYEGNDISVTLRGTNLTQDTFTIVASNPDVVTETSKVSDTITYSGSLQNGRYGKRETIGTQVRDTHYENAKTTIDVYYNNKLVSSRIVNVLNIHREPEPPTPITAFSVSGILESILPRSIERTSTATVTGGTAPFTYRWNLISTQTQTGIVVATKVSNNRFYITVKTNDNSERDYRGTITCTVTDANGLTVTDSSQIIVTFEQVPLVVPPPPAAPPLVVSIDENISASSTVDQNSGRSVTVDDGAFARVSGGTAPYTYRWTYNRDGGSGGTISTFSTLSPGLSLFFKSSTALSYRGAYQQELWRGTATCTVTDANRVTASTTTPVNLSVSVKPAPVTVPPPSAPPLTLSIDGSIEASGTVDQNSNQSVTVSDGASARATGGVAPYTYRWTYNREGGSGGNAFTYTVSGPNFTLFFKSSTALSYRGAYQQELWRGTTTCTVTDANGNTTSATTPVRLSVSVKPAPNIEPPRGGGGGSSGGSSGIGTTQLR